MALVQMTVKIPAHWLALFDKWLVQEGPGANRSDILRKVAAIGIDVYSKRRP